MATHLQYAKEFGDLFYEQVKQLIDRNQMQTKDSEILNKQDAILIQVFSALKSNRESKKKYNHMKN